MAILKGENKMNMSKRGTEKKIKITTTFKKQTLEKLDSYLCDNNVTRSYGLDYIVKHFLKNNPDHVIDD